VSLVGSTDKVTWERDASGLNITVPQSVPEQLAYVWRVVKKADQE